MDKNEIIAILHDWNFWRNKLKTGISRSYYLNILEKLLGCNHIIAITGSRRVGKSFIMRQMAKLLIDKGQDPRNILHVNLEDPRFIENDVQFLDKIFLTYCEFIKPTDTPIIFLDEIQEIEGFEKWIRMMHELSKAKIIVSGSNSKLLSRELGTLLTGRHLDLTVFPLSLKEFLEFNSVSIDENKGNDKEVKALLKDYIEYGSFPEVTLLSEKKEILLTYFDDVINKDIFKRFHIRKKQDLRSVVKYYFSNISNLSTFNAIERFLNISIKSVKNYTDYIEQAYLVFSLKRFSFKVKEQEKSPRKIYSIDTGLCNAVGFRFSQNLGRLVENIVFINLLKKQIHDKDTEIFYWKDEHHREVDFVVKQGLEIKTLIQVCWEMDNEKTRKREVRSLQKAIKELSPMESFIITEDIEGEENISGMNVKILPLWKWLLNLQ